MKDAKPVTALGKSVVTLPRLAKAAVETPLRGVAGESEVGPVTARLLRPGGDNLPVALSGEVRRPGVAPSAEVRGDRAAPPEARVGRAVGQVARDPEGAALHPAGNDDPAVVPEEDPRDEPEGGRHLSLVAKARVAASVGPIPNDALSGCDDLAIRLKGDVVGQRLASTDNVQHLPARAEARIQLSVRHIPGKGEGVFLNVFRLAPSDHDLAVGSDRNGRAERARPPVRAEVGDNAAALAEARIELPVRRVAGKDETIRAAALVVLAALAVPGDDDTPVGLESERMQHREAFLLEVGVREPAPAERRVKAPPRCVADECGGGTALTGDEDLAVVLNHNCVGVPDTSHIGQHSAASPEARVKAAVRQVPGEAETPPPEGATVVLAG